ncbi:MAG: CusA/CzcA family heavy metal efflux RND transporter [Leptospiraceae bacterium]|nr:CusA/CzcA family heavy metal efflux RND transporter [Leptospiraceae bacterium]MDW7976852.1 CusA/CzcA family heavy metal efflux RND transporter [Leptospiraceae bacterium]
MKRLQDYLIDNPVWTFLVISLIIIVGSLSVLRLSIDAVPDITGIQVMVQTKTKHLDPEQAEFLVTYPIEMELSGIQKVQEIRSITKFGLSLITVVFDDDMDLLLARQLINERLQKVQKELPEGIIPQLGPISTGLSEVFMYVLKNNDILNEKEKLLYLRTVQDWIIKPQLRTIQGAAEVDSIGGYSKAIFVEYLPNELNKYGIGPLGLLHAIEGIGEISSGGYSEFQRKRFIIKNDNRFFSLKEIQNFPIRIYSIGPALKLNNFAKVLEKEQPRIGAATFNGEETVLGTVLMRMGENSREVAKNAEEAIKSIHKPQNVKIHPVYSRKYLVDQTIKTVEKNLFEGSVLVISILTLILGNIRAAILVSLSIPLSMLIAFTGMVQNKISANLMSLGAIDFGLIVDASVVMVENILRNLEMNPNISKDQKKELIQKSIREVTPAIITGISIIIIVYIPVLFLEGIEGKMFRPMAITMIIALLGSLGIALFLIPSLSRLFLRSEVHENKFLKFSFEKIIKKIYKKIIIFNLRFGFIFLGITIILFFVSLYIFYKMPTEFVPDLDEQDLVIGIVRNSDISLEEMVEKQKMVEKIILEFPEVEHVFSRIGIPESATDPMGINFADTFIILKKDKNLWRKNEHGQPITKQDLLIEIRNKIQSYPQFERDEISPTQPIEMRFNEMLEGSRADISLRIFGPDLETLFELIEKIRAILESNLQKEIKELVQDELSALTKTPILKFETNPQALIKYGISQKDVNTIFEYSLAGKEIGIYYENQMKYPIIFRLDDKYRNSIDGINSIPIDLPEGGVISLRELSNFRIVEQVTTISRVNSKRYAALSIYLNSRDIEGFVKKSEPLVREVLKDYQDYYFEWAGQYKNLQRAKLRMMILIPLTIFVIALILYQNLESFVHTLLIITAIPFASIGGIFLLWIRDIPFSVSTSVGFIALSGIAILNGVVLLNVFKQLRQEGLDLQTTVIEGALMRIRPILMTALVAAFGFIPMAFNTGIGAEVQRPLATIVVGGLVTSTILTLLLLPYMYYKVEAFLLEKFKKT